MLPFPHELSGILHGPLLTDIGDKAHGKGRHARPTVNLSTPAPENDTCSQQVSPLDTPREAGRCEMLFLFWFLLVLAGACFFVLVPSLVAWPVYARYRGARLVTCPQTHGRANVRLDALHAATTGLIGGERLRLAACSLWP